MADDSKTIAENPNSLIGINAISGLALTENTDGVPGKNTTPVASGNNQVLEYNSNQLRCSAALVNAGQPSMSVRIALDKSGGMIYLPWKENSATHCKLPASGVYLFATGPLTGCNFYAAGQANSPTVMHINANASAGSSNSATKRALCDTIRGNNSILYQLERADTQALQAAGYLFGFKSTGIWQFSFVGTSISNMNNFRNELRFLGKP